jgi:hypothetical protein
MKLDTKQNPRNRKLQKNINAQQKNDRYNFAFVFIPAKCFTPSASLAVPLLERRD